MGKRNPMPPDCRACGRQLVGTSEWRATPAHVRKAESDRRMLHYGRGYCKRCYDAERRKAKGIAVRESPTSCKACGSSLIAKSEWWKKPKAERQRLEAWGVHYNAGHGFCAPCYKSHRYREPEYPAMVSGPLESVPDEFVHPAHRAFRERQRYFRKVSRRV